MANSKIDLGIKFLEGVGIASKLCTACYKYHHLVSTYGTTADGVMVAGETNDIKLCLIHNVVELVKVRFKHHQLSDIMVDIPTIYETTSATLNAEFDANSVVRLQRHEHSGPITTFKSMQRIYDQRIIIKLAKSAVVCKETNDAQPTTTTHRVIVIYAWFDKNTTSISVINKIVLI